MKGRENGSLFRVEGRQIQKNDGQLEVRSESTSHVRRLTSTVPQVQVQVRVQVRFQVQVRVNSEVQDQKKGLVFG